MSEAFDRYDRQVRLWGHDAQQMLQRSRVFFVGLESGVAAETAKNVVLAGVGQVILCDDRPVEADDPGRGQFFLLPQDVEGKHSVSTS